MISYGFYKQSAPNGADFLGKAHRCDNCGLFGGNHQRVTGSGTGDKAPVTDR